jgi:TIR domain
LSAAPHAFLSHASEDGVLAVRLAKDLLASGIDTFLDVWDITAGDSLRQRIDAGLGTCTHFLVLLTPISISKSWVRAEIDAAFVQKVLGRCKVIPMRCNLSPSDLPPLLGALYSPSLDDYGVAVPSLIADLYGVSQKPAIGLPPAFIKPALPAETGLTPATRSIVVCLIQGSQHGLEDDPLLSIHELQQGTGLPEESLVDAAFELEERGLVRLRRHLNVSPAGFDLVRPTASLFVAFDQFAMTWRPEEDALQIAVRLVSSSEGALVHTLSKDLCWSPRRINPAITYLEGQDLVQVSEMTSHPYARHCIFPNERTRRWVKSKS